MYCPVRRDFRARAALRPSGQRGRTHLGVQRGPLDSQLGVWVSPHNSKHHRAFGAAKTATAPAPQGRTRYRSRRLITPSKELKFSPTVDTVQLSQGDERPHKDVKSHETAKNVYDILDSLDPV